MLDATNLNGAFDIDIDTTNNVAIVYCSTGRVTSVDISNPASMSVLDSITDATKFDDDGQVRLDTSRQIAFVKCGGSADALTAVDYSDSSNLSIVGSITDTSSLGGRGLFLK